MNALLRQPFAILGALVFISLLGDIVTLNESLRNIVQAIQTVTRPVWAFVLGWLPWELPGYTKDYLTMGAIVAGMTLRMRLFRWKSIHDHNTEYKYMQVRFLTIPLVNVTPGQWFRFFLLDIPVRMIDNLLFWPVSLTYRLYRVSRDRLWEVQNKNTTWRRGYFIFAETFVWILIILTFNYTLFFEFWG